MRYLGIPFRKVFFSLAFILAVSPLVPCLTAQQSFAMPPVHDALRPGEILIYDISWSKAVSAGTAIMEVREKQMPDGKKVLDLILTGKSRGMVDRFFPVNDRAQSVFDPENMHSLSFQIYESFGKKKRHKSLIFDRLQNTVVAASDSDMPQTVSVPVRAQDALASLYYLRTMSDFTIGKVFAIDVHESGKNWSIEVHTLGRERVRTPAGEFNTIKVKTRPLHEGVFRNKGEVTIWLTDDSRKIPVQMQSQIKVGSFVFTLKGMRPGSVQTEQAKNPQRLALSSAIKGKNAAAGVQAREPR